MRIYLGQFILILILLGFVWYVFRMRSIFIDRIIYMVLGAGGILMILWPEFSTMIANAIGIGRGADLVFYLFILFSLFYYASLISELKSIDQKITSLVREIAIINANHSTSKESQ